MRYRDKAKVFRIWLCAALVIGAAGCSGFRKFSIRSAPSDPPIDVNGSLNDWTGRLYYVDRELVSIGTADDGESLFVGLAVDDPDMIEQLQRSGLTLWFDPQGGTKKDFGIQFPVRPRGETGGRGPGNRSPAGGRENGREGGQETDRFAPPGSGESRAFGFLRAGGKTASVIPMEPETGIEIKSGYTNGRFVYEARIPLVKTPNRPWAIGPGEKGIIGLGLQTSSLDSPSGRDGGPGERPGGAGGEPPMGGGKGGGRMPGGMGGGPGGMGERSDGSSRKLKLWAFVTLSPEPGTSVPTVFQDLAD